MQQYSNELAKNLHEIQAFNAERVCQWSTKLLTKKHD